MKDENFLNKEIAVRLNVFIKSKNWNKKQFAEAMSIHAQNVSKYLSGELEVSNLFYKLHRFGCDINWLISGAYPLEHNKNYYLDENTTISDWLESYYSGYIDEIRSRLKAVRESVFHPIDNFGDIDQVSEEYIKSVEDGYTRLSLGYIYFAIKTFNTNSIWLLTGAGDMYQPDHTVRIAMNRNNNTANELYELKHKYAALEIKFDYANELVKKALYCEESKSEVKKPNIDANVNVKTK